MRSNNLPFRHDKVQKFVNIVSVLTPFCSYADKMISTNHLGIMHVYCRKKQEKKKNYSQNVHLHFTVIIMFVTTVKSETNQRSL